MPLDFFPDGDRFQPGIVTSITNWIPTINGAYAGAPAPKLEGYATPLANAEVIGSALIKNAAGTAILYAGTAGKLYQAATTAAGGWTDRSGAAYSADQSWSFAQFSDKTLAANGVDKIQSASGGAFADLAAAAPTARIVVVHENAAVAFNTSSAPDGWFRSDTGDATNWTVGAANDVDSGLLRGGIGGPVVAATVYGPMLIAWKKNAMYSGLFTNGAGGAADPKIHWDFVPGGMGIGCVGQHAFVETDIGLIFLANRDIMLFDGGRPRSIAGKLKNWFFQNIVGSVRSNFFITHNEVERNVYIWYTDPSAPPLSLVYPTKAVVYSYETGRWGTLSTISNGLDGANDHVRCPVRGVNLFDYQAAGQFAAGGVNDCNPVWVTPSAGTGGRLANFSISAGQLYGGSSAMTLGLIGETNVDTTMTTIRQRSGNAATLPITAVSGNSYDSGMNATAFTGAANADGNANFAREGRWIQPTLTWGGRSGSAARYELADLVPDGVKGGRR